MKEFIESLEPKDIVTMGGISLTFLVGLSSTIFSILNSKNGRFINTISAERVKWINSLRNKFSDFDNRMYIQANNLYKLETGQISNESFADVDLYYELVYLHDYMNLYLNPREAVNKEFIAVTQNILSYFQIDNFNYDTYRESAINVRYLQQVILKSEWKRLKKETNRGKEITENEMQKIYREIAETIDKDKFNEIFKVVQ